MSETVLEKPESWMWHLIGFILPASVIAGNILGEWWVLGGTILALGIYPILDWDDRTTYEYLPANDLPYHPLEGKGYDSLGDWHSTKKVADAGSSEKTRNAGHQRECGLHEDLPEGYGFDI